ncbi:MAG: FlgD immunoglobulin-like domain containing protein [Gemmatimonadota bacterium]
MRSSPLRLSLYLLIAMLGPVQAAGFVCAGGPRDRAAVLVEATGKPASPLYQGQRSALVLFATFADDATWAEVPAWGAQLLDASLPGSLSHFYDTMSFGALRLRGEVGPRVYRSRSAAPAYLAPDATSEGGFGTFCREILEAADGDVDFSRFDNDGPDGVTSSGDDDGVADAVFIVIPRVPARFLLGPATGMGYLGEWGSYVTRDRGAGGQAVQVSAYQGTIQQGPTFDEAAGAMCHEYGHVLRLPDLYDTEYLRDPEAPPEKDSAGIGAWGLMGWGARGWNGTPGPNSLSAWSRVRLGWAQVVEPAGSDVRMELQDVGVSGQVGRVTVAGDDYLLLEYRRRSSSWYDRAIPSEGLLVWHVARALHEGELTPWWDVDLECADGRWADAGYPLGQSPDPRGGGDNLDFWAHDGAYAAAHGGNLGDATDPFDGARYRDLTGDTNPAALSRDGAHGVRLTQITLQEDRAWLQVEMSPPVVELLDVGPRDQRVAAGRAVSISFHLANRGASLATGMWAELHTEDEVLEILHPRVELSVLRPGDRTIGASVGPQGFPQVRFPEDLTAEHEATVELTIHGGTGLLARGTATLTGVPAHRVTVAVTDSGGAPLAGVPVGLEEEAVPAPVLYDHQIDSDSAGVAVFHVPTGTYRLRADPGTDSPWGAVDLWDLPIAKDTAYELSLPRAYVLSGVARDPDGRPVGSQYVVLRWMEGASTRSMSWPVRSDGTFSFKVPAGDYDVGTQAIAGSSAIPAQQHRRIHLDRDLELEITLGEGVTLAVRVVDPGGAAIPGVRVQAYQSTVSYYTVAASALTGGDGEVRLPVMPGLYELGASEPPAPFVPLPSRVPVTVAADTAMDLVLERGVSVAVRLVTETGEPARLPLNCAFVLSAVDRGASRTVSVPSLSDSFAIGVVPGRYQVALQVSPVVGTDESVPPSQSFGTFEIGRDTLLVLPVVTGAAITGTVYGRYGGSTGSNSILFAGPGSVYAYTNLGTDGAYAIRLVPGEYGVQVSLAGGALSAPSQILGTTVVTGDTVLDWHLMEDDVVSGRLVDPAGEGVGGAALTASGRAGGQRVSNRALTRLDGGFDMRLPAGEFAFRASSSHPDGTTLDWWLADLEMPPLEPPVLSLPGGASLSVTCEGASGVPAQFVFRLHAGPFDLARATSEYYVYSSTAVTAIVLDGELDGAQVAPGTYAAIVSPASSASPRYGRVVPLVQVAGVTRLTATLPAPEGAAVLSGRATGRDGSVPQVVGLEAYEAGLGLLAECRALGSRYELALPPGTYELMAYTYSLDEGYAYYDQGRVTVDGDRTLDLVLGEPTVVEADPGATPLRFALEQSYPNPFNGETVIDFAVTVDSPVDLGVYDLLGQRVRTLAHGWRPAGWHAAAWDGRDDAGQVVATGVYLYRLEAREGITTRKLLRLR